MPCGVQNAINKVNEAFLVHYGTARVVSLFDAPEAAGSELYAPQPARALALLFSTPNMIPHVQTQQQHSSAAAAAVAALISSAERPSLVSRREGAILRLVPANERLSPAQLEQQLHQLLVQPHMQCLLAEHSPPHLLLLSKREAHHTRSMSSSHHTQMDEPDLKA